MSISCPHKEIISKSLSLNGNMEAKSDNNKNKNETRVANFFFFSVYGMNIKKEKIF